MVSAPSFRLKGGGWYETDFKTGNKKNLSSNDNKSSKNLTSDSKKEPKQDKITK
jgi:predicted nucleic acid-binding Zn ribbon protein